MGKKIDIQHNHVIVSAGEEVPSGYVGLLAKADGLYERLPGASGAERKLYNESTSGGSSVTSVTYSELVALISASGLTPGAQYLISDFATVHYFINLNEDTSLYTRISGAINTGSVEPIIVTATAVNKLSADAKSTVYPSDRLLYDWNPDNWLSDISFGYDGSIVSGFKGVIYYRHDTIQNNELQYDFRNVKFRRWKINLPAWSSATTYAKGATVLYGGFAYFSLRGSNLNNNPGSSPSQWACFNEDYYPGSAYDYMCVNSSVYGNYSIYTGDDAYYQDFYTFENYANVFEYHVVNNQSLVYQFGSYTPIGIGTILTGVVWFMPWDTSILYNIRINGWYEMCTLITESVRDIVVNDFKWNIGTLMGAQTIICKGGFAYNQFLAGQISDLNAHTFNGNVLSGNLQCKNAGEVDNNILAGYTYLYSVGRFSGNTQYYNTSFITSGAGRITFCTLAVNMYNILGDCSAQDFTGAAQVSNSNRTNTLVRTGSTTNALVYYSGTTQYIVAANA